MNRWILVLGAALALGSAVLAEPEAEHTCCATFSPEGAVSDGAALTGKLEALSTRIGSDMQAGGEAGAAAPRKRYALLVLVDGGQADKMRALLARGKLPNIRAHLVDRGLSCFDAVTIWPSTSVPAHVSIVTGRFPLGHGILFPKWLDRATRHYRDYIGLHITRLGRDMRDGTTTLFEHLAPWRSLSALEICHRGASYFLPGTPRDGLTARLAITMQSVLLWSGRVAAAFLRITRLNREATGTSSLPRLIVLSLPEIDHQTHLVDLDSPESDAVHEEMDRHFGNIVRSLQNMGVYDDTVIALTSDHGMGPVHTHVPIHRMLTAHGLRVLPATRQVTLGMIGGVFDRIPGMNVDRFDAVVMWGGNSEVALHLRGSTWDVRPDAGALRPLVGWLLAQQGIELVLGRAADGAILVHGARGTGRIEVTGTGTARDRRYGYRVLAGTDPLGYASDPAVAPLCGGRPASAETWLAATARHAYPDVPVRLGNHFGDARDADLYVIAARGHDFVPPELADLKAKTGRPRLAGTHGHLNREQSAVPFLIAGPGIRHGTLPHARTVDMVPTMLEALGKPFDPASTDGVSRITP